MKFTSVLSALALFVAASQASYMSYSSPKKDEKYSSGKSNEISWDKSSIKNKGKMSMYLCKGGSIDITQTVTIIASDIENTGSYSWSPPSSLDLSIEIFTIIIVDSSNQYYNSDNFYVYKGDDKYNTKSEKNYNTKSENNDKTKSYEHNTKTYEHNTKTYEQNTKTYEHNTKSFNNYHNKTTKTVTVTKTTSYESTSTVTLPGNTYTTVIMITETLTSCLTTPVLETQTQTLPPFIPTYQSPPPVAVTTYQSEPIYTLSNFTTPAVTPPAAETGGFFTTSDIAGTTVGPVAPVFTGAATMFNLDLKLVSLVAVAGVACLF